MTDSSLETRLTSTETRLATIELRMKTHWALQSDEQFAETYVKRVRNDLNLAIAKMALGAVVLLAGSGFVFIKYAVNEQFSTANSGLIAKLKESYDAQVERTDSNFEWRRFHDYGKDYVNLATLYSLSPLEQPLKDEKLHKLLAEAHRYFSKALSHGRMQASTYWELGELAFSYPKAMKLESEIDRLKAIQHYEDAVSRYTDVEVSKGWRAEAKFKLAAVYADLWRLAGPPAEQTKWRDAAKKHAREAKDEYSKVADPTDERTLTNIREIATMLATIERAETTPAGSAVVPSPASSTARFPP
jgi:hypothetical protein